LGEEPFVEIHADDAVARGLADGVRAIVRTSAGESSSPFVSPSTSHAGTVFVPFNQPGFAANTILAGSFTIAATVEAVADAPGALEPVEVAAMVRSDGLARLDPVIVRWWSSSSRC